MHSIVTQVDSVWGRILASPLRVLCANTRETRYNASRSSPTGLLNPAPFPPVMSSHLALAASRSFKASSVCPRRCLALPLRYRALTWLGSSASA